MHAGSRRRLAIDTVRIEGGSIIGGAPDEGGFLARCERDGRTTAVLSVERPRPFEPARRELARGASVVEAAVAYR
ncbi:hypothetical protein [Streptomyces sp. NPDC048825]|uniref:hypothetical protein n=1 Tax=Streptomyces sp. NPDC048825 TaxID=3365592 RepID=UPI003710FD2E